MYFLYIQMSTSGHVQTLYNRAQTFRLFLCTVNNVCPKLSNNRRHLQSFSFYRRVKQWTDPILLEWDWQTIPVKMLVPLRTEAEVRRIRQAYGLKCDLIWPQHLTQGSGYLSPLWHFPTSGSTSAPVHVCVHNILCHIKFLPYQTFNLLNNN